MAIAPGKPNDRVSCRALNPLSLGDDLSKVFLDERQAQATTATRLFRNDELFDSLARKVMPAFFAGRGLTRSKFTIWSSGCSSGEEVYSLAMVSLNIIAKAGRRVQLEAFGTDINQNRIAEARAGVYLKPTESAFSPECWRLLALYAAVGDSNVKMGEHLKSICKFAIFDMRKRPKKHTFDFIVCNHVLQYYDNPGQLLLLENLLAVLNPGGFLYLEGITNDAMNGSGIRKIDGCPNLFLPGKGRQPVFPGMAPRVP